MTSDGFWNFSTTGTTSGSAKEEIGAPADPPGSESRTVGGANDVRVEFMVLSGAEPIAALVGSEVGTARSSRVNGAIA